MFRPLDRSSAVCSLVTVCKKLAEPEDDLLEVETCTA
jgi:hypothetical protein